MKNRVKIQQSPNARVWLFVRRKDAKADVPNIVAVPTPAQCSSIQNLKIKDLGTFLENF